MDIVFCMIITVLALCSASDIFTMQVRNTYILLLMFAGIPVFFSDAAENRLRNILFAVLIILFGVLINRKKTYMGGADIKLLSVLCVINGPEVCFRTFTVACIAACIYVSVSLLPLYIIKAILKKAQNTLLGKQLPFVPFITFGYIFTELYFT